MTIIHYDTLIDSYYKPLNIIDNLLVNDSNSYYLKCMKVQFQYYNNEIEIANNLFKSLDKETENTHFLNLLGLFHLHSKDDELAFHYFNQSIVEDTNNYWPLLNIAILKQNMFYDKISVIEDFENALIIFPDSNIINICYADSLIKFGELQKASKVLSNVKDEYDPVCINQLYGDIYYGLNNLELSENYYKKSLSYDSNYELSTLGLVDVYTKQNKLEMSNIVLSYYEQKPIYELSSTMAHYLSLNFKNKKEYHNSIIYAKYALEKNYDDLYLCQLVFSFILNSQMSDANYYFDKYANHERVDLFCFDIAYLLILFINKDESYNDKLNEFKHIYNQHDYEIYLSFINDIL